MIPHMTGPEFLICSSLYSCQYFEESVTLRGWTAKFRAFMAQVGTHSSTPRRRVGPQLQGTMRLHFHRVSCFVRPLLSGTWPELVRQAVLAYCEQNKEDPAARANAQLRVSQHVSRSSLEDAHWSSCCIPASLGGTLTKYSLSRRPFLISKHFEKSTSNL